MKHNDRLDSLIYANLTVEQTKALAEWLVNDEDGIFDIMHIWESDEE